MPNTKTPIPDRKLFMGCAIKKARERKGMTQLALAHEIGLNGKDAGAYICRVEAGQEPRIETLQRIVAALDVTLDSLLTSV